MTRLFLICLGLILAGGIFIQLTKPENEITVPILTWVTDPNPARYEQIDFFHEWLIENGHVTETGEPVVRLKLETGGVDNKKIIHGVSGVAGDILDMYNETEQFYKLGILEDVTEAAKKYNFGIEHTFPAMKSNLVFNGRQYGFPCNVTSHACWANMDILKEHGINQLPESWTIEEFERIGKAFVEKANQGKERNEYFFMNNPGDGQFSSWITVLLRSTGSSFYNETMTRCIMDQGDFAKLLDLNMKWIEEDRIFPSAAEASSFSSASGYGGAKMSLFLEGRYAMITLGRWILVRMREMENPPEISVARYPYVNYENSIIMARSSTIYKGSKNKELAYLFLSYLASEKYNQQIVDSADALPPNPKYCETESFNRPKKYPNEWGAHERAYRSAYEISIPEAKSPYVSQSILLREMMDAFEKVQSRMASSTEASSQSTDTVNKEIERNLKNSVLLSEKFTKAQDLQNKIDELKKQGKPIPEDWVINPFWKKYYREKGLLSEL